MLSEIAYHDGVWGRPSQLSVSLEDRGFLFGEGVYDVVLAYNHVFWALEHHLDRLEYSLGEVEMSMPCSRAELAALLEQAKDQVGGDCQHAYIQITRGGGRARCHDYEACRGDSSLTLIVRELDDDHSYMQDGRSAILLPDNRWGRCDIKTTGLLANTMAASLAHRAGAAAAIYHKDGGVTESHSHSVFIVKDGRLITRPLSPAILPSVTRQQIIEYAPAWRIPVEQRVFSVEELLAADEVLLMSASKHPLPIVSVAGQANGDGRVGPLARRIYELFEAEIAAVCGPRRAGR